jgi:hypothetical protein
MRVITSHGRFAPECGTFVSAVGISTLCQWQKSGLSATSKNGFREPDSLLCGDCDWPPYSSQLYPSLPNNNERAL